MKFFFCIIQGGCSRKSQVTRTLNMEFVQWRGKTVVWEKRVITMKIPS